MDTRRVFDPDKLYCPECHEEYWDQFGAKTADVRICSKGHEWENKNEKWHERDRMDREEKLALVRVMNERRREPRKLVTP